MLRKFLDPTNDFAFKKIFGTEKNKDILLHFLNDMIQFKDKARIQDVAFIPTIQDPAIAADKCSIVDVMCQDQEGRQHIVEMQVASTTGFEKRAQYYAARAYARQLNQGEDYELLKEVIFLAITNFPMFPNKPAYKSDHVILDRKSLENDLQDFSFTFLELPKFKKKATELTNIVEKWSYYLKHGKDTSAEQLGQIIGKDRILARAYQAIDEFNWDKEDLLAYEQVEKKQRDLNSAFLKQRNDGIQQGRKEGIQQGRKEGIQQGRLEGIQQGRLEMAQSMLKEGAAIDFIRKVTGLSKEELDKIALTGME